jgi:hypothetical protein
MREDRAPKNLVEIYLTREQILRLAAASADALVGVQIGSDCADNTKAYIHFVDFDQAEKHWDIYTDGSYEDVT